MANAYLNNPNVNSPYGSSNTTQTGSYSYTSTRTGDPGVIAARDALAAQLGRDPYYAYGRAQDQAYAGLLDAMDQGRTALRSGPNAIHPEDFADRFGARTPAGQEAERVAMRGSLDSDLQQSGSDLAVLARRLQGEDGFNTAKLGTAFGQDAADRLTGAVARERLCGANRQPVMGDSSTGERQAVRGLTQPDMNSGLGGWWNNLYIDEPSTYLPSFLSPEAMGGAIPRGPVRGGPREHRAAPDQHGAGLAMSGRRGSPSSAATPP